MLSKTLYSKQIQGFVFPGGAPKRVYYSELVTRNCKVLRWFDDYNEQWLDFVVLNRDDTRPSPAHDYDIVEGPVADDKVRYNM